MAPAKKRKPSPVSTVDDLGEQASAASDMLKAMSHPMRLLILCLLVEGEKTVSEIEEATGLSQPTVSQHLARLRFDRLLSTRKESRTVYYSIAEEKVLAIITTLYEQFCSD